MGSPREPAPSRQAVEEGGAGNSASLGTQLGPKSAEAETGWEAAGPRDGCQGQAVCSLSLHLSSCQKEKEMQVQSSRSPCMKSRVLRKRGVRARQRRLELGTSLFTPQMCLHPCAKSMSKDVH